MVNSSADNDSYEIKFMFSSSNIIQEDMEKCKVFYFYGKVHVLKLKVTFLHRMSYSFGAYSIAIFSTPQLRLHYVRTVRFWSVSHVQDLVQEEWKSIT